LADILYLFISFNRLYKNKNFYIKNLNK